MNNFSWTKLGAYITASLTALAMIPYDKDTLDLINRVFPPTWIPWVIKGGIFATLFLRLLSLFQSPKQ